MPKIKSNFIYLLKLNTFLIFNAKYSPTATKYQQHLSLQTASLES